MTTTFIDPNYQKLLSDSNLDSFDAIWDAKVDWFEEPNERRGGWSGVGKFFLNDGGLERGVFLKRQQNHQRKTLAHPIAGQPTFSCEFEMIQLLTNRQVPTLKPIAFGVRKTKQGDQAILMTEELLGFESFENATDKLFSVQNAKPSISTQNALIRQVASTVAKLHAASVQHRSLYPKHLFVHKDGTQETRVIDLEKSRVKYFSMLRALYDLSTLNRHSKHWSNTRRLYFFLQYLGVSKLTFASKFLCRLIIKRSKRTRK